MSSWNDGPFAPASGAPRASVATSRPSPAAPADGSAVVPPLEPTLATVAPKPPPPHLRQERIVLADGARTTVHVATYDAAATRARLVLLPRPEPLAAWCAARGIADALVAGFYVRPHGTPLGEVRTRGIAREHVSFEAPWHARRSCVHIAAGGALAIAPRDELPPAPHGDLLQAGPLLVRDGRSTIVPGVDPEGFSAGSAQFDSDITTAREPRTALALTADGTILALACDGRAPDEAGLTLAELADVLLTLGARSALNLDGGGSTSLVCGGVLRNTPRGEWDTPLPLGRHVTTAFVFEPRERRARPRQRTRANVPE